MGVDIKTRDDVMHLLHELNHQGVTIIMTTHEINAVVLDLRNEKLDSRLDTEAVEQVLARIESWGAEPILTGISPASEDVIHAFESRHLLVRKNLDEAIAAAFLITEAQRYAA